MEKGKERLFEVMGRLDKTFKPKLNEEIGDMGDNGMPDTGQAPDFQDMPEPTPMPDEEVPAEEKSPEEKLAELTAKVDELYALLHGEAEEVPAEVPAEEPEGIEVTTGEVEPENLQEWNFDKKKGKKEEKAEDKEDDEKEEKKEEVDEAEEVKKEKIPVAAVAKVGK